MMSSAQVIEISVNVTSNSSSQADDTVTRMIITCVLSTLVTSNNQGLIIKCVRSHALSFAKLVIMSSAPAKSANDARDASQDPFTHSTCIINAFFLRRTQLLLIELFYHISVCFLYFVYPVYIFTSKGTS